MHDTTTDEPIDLDAAAEDPAVVAVAREWIRICVEDYNEWPDLTPGDIPALTTGQVIGGVARYWAGGLEAFVQDCAPDIADRRAAGEPYVGQIYRDNRTSNVRWLRIDTDTDPAHLNYTVIRQQNHGEITAPMRSRHMNADHLRKNFHLVDEGDIPALTPRT